MEREEIGMKRLKGRRLLPALLVMLAICLSGCSSRSYDNASSNMTSGVADRVESQMTAYEEDMGAMADGEAGAMDSNAPQVYTHPSQEVNTGTERKLIKTVHLEVETREFDTMLSALDSQIAASGGYVEQMETYNGSVYSGYRQTRSASMTVRIPKDQLRAFLDTVSGIGNVISRSESEEDVTLNYVDLKSHKEALETEASRLLELLERAETVEDIITIEQRLSSVRYQIESMESQLRTYDNKVDYSTVYLNLSEVKELTPVEEDSAWERIAAGFQNSIKSIGSGCLEFGIWFLINIPYLLIWILLIAVMIFAARWLYGRKGSGKKEKRAEKSAGDRDGEKDAK